MVEAYQGVLQADGRLMVNGSLVKLKTPRRVAFNFLDSDVVKTETKAQKQNRSLNQFFAALDAVEGEDITDNDLANLESSRISFKKELAE